MWEGFVTVFHPSSSLSSFSSSFLKEGRGRELEREEGGPFLYSIHHRVFQESSNNKQQQAVSTYQKSITKAQARVGKRRERGQSPFLFPPTRSPSSRHQKRKDP